LIHLHHSNRTEALLAALVRNVRDERRARGPFAPVRLVVPNRNVETYVKLGLAEALGIAANLEVTFLRKLLALVAERALPGARAVDARQIEGHLLVLLHDERLLETPALAPVRDYLLAAGGKPDVVDRRRCQLAAELAQLFDEYGSSRPELLASWRERGGREAGDAVASWQRALWLEIFGPGGLVARRSAADGVGWRSLPELIALAEARGTLDAAGLGPALHLFGISYVARSYHRMLAAIGRELDVHLYTLNPCREFWEDLETTTELRRRLKREGREGLFPPRAEARQPGLALDDDPFALQSEAENLPLRLWGRPGRENVRLLNQLTGGDFHARFVSHRESGGARTLLARLQDDILDRLSPAGPDPALRADGSVAVLACPGVRRELEVVAAEIWRLVRAEPTLRFNDIAVVVPEARKALYLSHVGAVFGEASELPHSVIDLPLGGGHRLGEAVEMLLALPLGSFTRKELLPLLCHPSLIGRFPEASAAGWLRLCDELGIVHGADHGDHQGTYIERDLLNWDQGIRRVVLGAFMAAGADGDGEPVAQGGQQYLPLSRPGDEEEGALGFALLARSLIEDARFAAGLAGGPRTRPLPQWLDFIRGLLGGYLVPQDPEEEALLGRCLAEIDQLEELPLGDVAVSYRVAAELARRAVAGLGGTRGQYLAQGVTVSSFVPMRAIPFRAAFVLGLGQGDFPSAARRSELDLREGRRLPGDVTPREQDLYMFLETLLCARERLVLSYVARDELTGERLSPSSVILELREILATGYLPPGELGAVFGEALSAPLRRWDDEGRLAAMPIARRERVARELGRSLRQALPAGAALPDLPALRRALDPETFAALAHRLGVHAPPERRAAPSAPPARLVVPLIALRRFLEDPLQGSARFRLRMREIEGDEELLDRVDEPFETDRLTRARLLPEAMVAALLEPGVPDWERVRRAFEQRALREELAGALPTGFLARAERPRHDAVLGGWLQEVAALGSLRRSVIRFGPGLLGEAAAEACDPIVLTIDAPAAGAGARPLEVHLVGRTELLVDAVGAGGSLTFVARSKSSHTQERKQRDGLRAFVDHLALAAAGLRAGPHAALLAWAAGDDHRLDRARFREVEPTRARAYLGAIVREMLTGARDPAGAPTGVHPYLLPCEAVFAAGPEGDGRALVEEVEKLRDHYFEQPFLTFSSVLGPVPEAVERHDPPPPEEARRMAEARFGLYFELLEEDGKK
jgi:exodeoxyribonuclease V gamma subunit